MRNDENRSSFLYYKLSLWPVSALPCMFKGGAVGGFFVYMWFFAANNKVFLLIYVVVLLNLRYGSEEIASNIL